MIALLLLAYALIGAAFARIRMGRLSLESKGAAFASAVLWFACWPAVLVFAAGVKMASVAEGWL